jgi:general L-amino acid transport system permease protein
MTAKPLASLPSRAAGTARPSKFGSFLLQASLALLIAWGLWFIISNTLHNLSVRGITTGYGFLNRAAGFDVAFSLFPFTSRSPIWAAFLVGVTNTLFLAVVGIFLGTLLGVSVAYFRISRSPLAAWVATAYIELFRNTPVLLHLFFWYFAVLSQLPPVRNSFVIANSVFLNNRGLFVPEPSVSALAWFAVACVIVVVLTTSATIRRRQPTAILARCSLSLGTATILSLGVLLLGSINWQFPERAGLGIRGGLSIIPELVAVIIAISLYSSAFIAELLRGAIQTVDRGQTEAGQAVGLSRSAIMRLVVMPQAIRIVIPPLTNMYVNVIKQTAVVAAIAFPDLMHIFGKTVLTQTGQAIEVLMLATSVYLAISLACAGVMHLYAASLRAKGGGR